MEVGVGGWSEVRPATEKIQNICDQVKSKADEMAGKTFPQFVAISYREQLVAGMNYSIKVDVGSPGSPVYWSLGLFQALPAYGGALTVSSFDPLNQ